MPVTSLITALQKFKDQISEDEPKSFSALNATVSLICQSRPCTLCNTSLASFELHTFYCWQCAVLREHACIFSFAVHTTRSDLKFLLLLSCHTTLKSISTQPTAWPQFIVPSTAMTLDPINSTAVSSTGTM